MGRIHEQSFIHKSTQIFKILGLKSLWLYEFRKFGPFHFQSRMLWGLVFPLWTLWRYSLFLTLLHDSAPSQWHIVKVHSTPKSHLCPSTLLYDLLATFSSASLPVVF